MIRATLPSLLAVALLPLLSAHAPCAHAQAADATQVRYTVKLLTKDLGGTTTIGNSLNNLGWVAGRANTPGNGRRAILWRDGNPTGLGVLGTRPETQNSLVLWPVKNTAGLVSGISHTDAIDPNGEPWSCGAFMANPGGHACRGFVWQDGAMRELPTFGGTHGFATGTNNHGLTVGWAEFDEADATCNPASGQKLRFSAALWGPEPERIRELPPLPGHTASAATAINDSGQVVGISGICDQAVGRYSALEAVIWEDGMPRAIGHLPGNAWHTPNMINEAGTVVGFSNYDPAIPGEVLFPQGFIWRQATGIEAIDFIDGHDNAIAKSVNQHDQVVGQSCAGDDCRAFVWQDGRTVDLNSLRQPGSSSRALLVSANDIDDLGRITGYALSEGNKKTGLLVAFIATPVED